MCRPLQLSVDSTTTIIKKTLRIVVSPKIKHASILIVGKKSRLCYNLYQDVSLLFLLSFMCSCTATKWIHHWYKSWRKKRLPPPPLLNSLADLLLNIFSRNGEKKLVLITLLIFSHELGPHPRRQLDLPLICRVKAPKIWADIPGYFLNAVALAVSVYVVGDLHVPERPALSID